VEQRVQGLLWEFSDVDGEVMMEWGWVEGVECSVFQVLNWTIYYSLFFLSIDLESLTDVLYVYSENIIIIIRSMEEKWPRRASVTSYKFRYTFTRKKRPTASRGLRIKRS
jgi:hypothetical protein